MKCVLQLAQSALVTRALYRLSPCEKDVPAVLLVHGLIADLAMDHAVGVLSVPRVRVRCLVGRDALESEMLDEVLLDIPLPPSAPRALTSTNTSPYNVNLDEWACPGGCSGARRGERGVGNLGTEPVGHGGAV